MSFGDSPIKHPVFQEELPGGRLRCTLCPRYCELGEGQRGLCFVRQHVEGQIQLTTYGRSSGFVIDPIEKKPLNHFYPGSSVLSFGTAGCNLSCKFCQNWDMSKSREMDILQSPASPQQIAQAALREGCSSVAFTYNDPVIFYEYAVDTARACKELGLKTVAVTAGYISESARPGFFEHIDAANVDLKGFTQNFYRDLCAGDLQPVLDTLAYLVHETDTWVEITNLVIPGENDSADEIRDMCTWIYEELGDHIPLHFSAFHPDYKLKEHSRTSAALLQQAYRIAQKVGLQHVYLGNIHDPERTTSYCRKCGEVLIERSGYEILTWGLAGTGSCGSCGELLPGHFTTEPGQWGNRYMRVHP